MQADRHGPIDWAEDRQGGIAPPTPPYALPDHSPTTEKRGCAFLWSLRLNFQMLHRCFRFKFITIGIGVEVSCIITLLVDEVLLGVKSSNPAVSDAG